MSDNVPSPLKTYWKASEDGTQLLRVGEGMDYWTNQVQTFTDFPMSASDVATMMNKAFTDGVNAHKRAVRELMGFL